MLAFANALVGWVNIFAIGGLITLILVGSGIYCLVRWRSPTSVVVQEETRHVTEVEGKQDLDTGSKKKRRMVR